MFVKPREAYKKGLKPKTIELMLRVVADFNGGIDIVTIAKKNGISRARTYQLLNLAESYTPDTI